MLETDAVVTPAQRLVTTWLREWGYTVENEVRVVDGRRFAWDVCIPSERIAIECDGYYKGRHGAGWGSDNEKANLGVMLGWRVLRFSNADVIGKKGTAYEFLRAWFAPK